MSTNKQSSALARKISEAFLGKDRYYYDELHGSPQHAALERIIDECMKAPVVLYFVNDSDRKEFVALVQQAKPGLIAQEL